MKNEETIEQLIEKLSRLQTEQTETINRIAALRSEEELSRTQDVPNDESSIPSTVLQDESISVHHEDCAYRLNVPDRTPRSHDTNNSGSRPTNKSGYYKRRISVSATNKDQEPDYYWKPAPTNIAPQRIFRESTRVYITNSVTPKNAGVHDERDRRATVIGIEYRNGDTRVIINTDNNARTYRFPKYLGLLYVDTKKRADGTATRYQDQYD